MSVLYIAMYGQTVRGNSLLVRVWAIREAVCGNGKYLHRESEGHVTGESKTNTHHVANPGVSPAVACCAARSSAAASPDSSSRFRASPKVSSKGQYFDCKEKCQSICVRRVLDDVWTTGRGNRYVYWTLAWSTVTGHQSEP